MEEFAAYMGRLAAAKLEDPAADVVSDLALAQRDDPSFSDAELTMLAAGLLSAPGGIGLVRYAHEDIAIGGETIARGDAVIIANAAANRDPSAFAEPERFDPSRSPNAHLAFGHGAHFRIGASLARIELHAVFRGLFARFPGLRLAVGVDDLRVRTGRITGGVEEVPVTWW
ncbi:MAG: cytochrome P450 [Streptosporangiales bacterium]|nr:cytochrome P450 [Streptosporangiales bacterium]